MSQNSSKLVIGQCKVKLKLYPEVSGNPCIKFSTYPLCVITIVKSMDCIKISEFESTDDK